jgi:ankyrin repeat protein
MMKKALQKNTLLFGILGVALCALGFYVYRSLQNKGLLEAIEHNDEQTALTLLQRGADPNQFRTYNATNPAHIYPLSASIREEGSLRVVKALLERGANLNPPDSYLEPPLYRAITAKRPDMLRLLLEKGARDTDTHSGAIRQAAASLECYRALRQYYYPATLVDACHAGDLDDARSFLDQGEDANQQNRFGETPLIMAAQNRHEDVVKLLIARGADVNREGQYGSPLYVLQSRRDILRQTLQHYSQAGLSTRGIHEGLQPDKIGQDEAIIALLKAKGAHLSLIEAIQAGDVQEVRNRIREGANVNRIPESHLLTSEGRPLPQNAPLFQAIAALNIASAPSPNGMVSDLTPKKLTRAQTREIVHLLLDAGANPNLKTDSGQTLLMLAANNPDAVRLLLAKGADVHAL